MRPTTAALCGHGSEYAWEKVAAGYVKPYGIRHWWLDCDEPCGLLPTDRSVLDFHSTFRELYPEPGLTNDRVRFICK
jgi:hypothetical protein